MLITIHVQPNAKMNAVVNWLDETTVKIKIAAPPVDGKANKMLLQQLSEWCNLPVTSFIIVRGGQTRMKQVVLPDNAYERLRMLS